MAKEENFPVTLRCRVPVGWSERLGALAKRKGSTKAQAIRDALIEYLDRNEDACDAQESDSSGHPRPKPVIRDEDAKKAPNLNLKKPEEYGSDQERGHKSSRRRKSQ